MHQVCIDSLVGWSVGHQYANAHGKENEIKQGKNFYLSAPLIFGQLSQLGALISKINETLSPHPFKTPVNLLCNVVPILGLPASLFCAAVKQGDYESLVEFYHSSGNTYIQFPETLNGRTVALFSFFTEHSGNIIQVAMVVSSVSLIVLGNRAYGIAILTALTYDIIDQMGLAPRRISLFMEIYMPTVSLLGSLLGGTVLVRTLSVMVLSTRIVPSLTLEIHRRIDAFIRHFWDVAGPDLRKIDAPLVKQEKMTFEKIQEILDSDDFDDEYEINPAHCSQFTINLESFPTDRNFDQYLTLFDAINWEDKYDLVLNKLKDDDRFIDFLFEKYPTVKKEDLASEVENYISELSAEEGIRPEEYAAHWMREQMIQLVDMLQGRKRVKGLQQDLDEAIQVCSILLPYLLSLEDEMELEDGLLKLAVEAGDYCARGVKRTANELIWGIIQNGIEKTEDDDIDSTKSYEIKLSQALQNRRYRIIESVYEILSEKMDIPDVIAKDTHGFDIYRLYFSLGFFPLTTFERNRMGMLEIAIWEFYAQFREAMYLIYQNELDKVVEEVGETEFGIYIQQIIGENELLSDQEKEELLEKLTERNDDQWTAEETIERFHRLLFVRLGILIPVSE